jgi:hypothetical protein
MCVRYQETRQHDLDAQSGRGVTGSIGQALRAAAHASWEGKGGSNGEAVPERR